MWTQIVPAIRMALILTILTGLVYPAVVTGLCQMLFRDKANGSLVTVKGKVVGSALLGQNFARPEYFHPRPSAAGLDGYDAANSSGSNLGPTNQKLIDRVKADVTKFRAENPEYTGPVPADAVTTSGSGLDPDISLAFARAQSNRVARARGLSADQVEELLRENTRERQLGFLGEPRVQVLGLNVALDSKFARK